MNWIKKIGVRSVQYQPKQSILSIFVTTVMILSIILILTILYTRSSVINTAQARLGADVVVVAEDSDLSDKALIFSSEPSRTYMPASVSDTIRSMEDVETSTAQFYAHSLEASCCDVGRELRMIGVDQSTDFLLKPWLLTQEDERLTQDDLIAGERMNIEKGNTVILLGKAFNTSGKLYRTGTGMDDSIFIDIAEARRLAKEKLDAELFEGRDVDELISSVFIKLKDPKKAGDFVTIYNLKHEGSKAIQKSTVINEVNAQFSGTVELMGLLVSGFFAVILLFLMVHYASMIKDRNAELSYIRFLGYQESMIYKIIGYETMLLGAVSAAVGTLLGFFLIDKSMQILQDSFRIAMIQLQWNEKLGIIAVAVVIVLLINLLFGLLPVRSLLKGEQLDYLKGRR